MTEVRPYRLSKEEAIDLNMLARVTLCDNSNKASFPACKPWIVLLILSCYTDPIILDFDSKAQAMQKYNDIFVSWGRDEVKEEVFERLDRFESKLDAFAEEFGEDDNTIEVPIVFGGTDMDAMIKRAIAEKSKRDKQK